MSEIDDTAPTESQTMRVHDGAAAEADMSHQSSDGDLGDLLQELRVLLPGTQTLTAFLVILPFNGGFSQIEQGEKLVYLATFLCSVCSLVLFTAPAAQHRLQRPLSDRERFKTNATRLMVAGLVPLSAALVLATHLVLSEVLSDGRFAWITAGVVAALIAVIWWVVPLRLKRGRENIAERSFAPRTAR
jgi:O-antigen/teichoic acid export membrane protein